MAISSPSPSPVSDYIPAPDFALNICCHDMAEVKFLWFLSFFAFLTFLRDRFFSKFDKIPLQSSARHRQPTPSQVALRPLRPCYFGHWESVADEWQRSTCGIYLEWKLHDEGKHLKWNLHSEGRHSLQIVALALLLLLSYPTYRRPNQLCYCARTTWWISQYFNLGTFRLLNFLQPMSSCLWKFTFFTTNMGFELGPMFL